MYNKSEVGRLVAVVVPFNGFVPEGMNLGRSVASEIASRMCGWFVLLHWSENPFAPIAFSYHLRLTVKRKHTPRLRCGIAS